MKSLRDLLGKGVIAGSRQDQAEPWDLQTTKPEGFGLIVLVTRVYVYDVMYIYVERERERRERREPHTAASRIPFQAIVTIIPVAVLLVFTLLNLLQNPILSPLKGTLL